MKSLSHKLAVQLGKMLRDVVEVPNIIIESCDEALKKVGDKAFDKWYDTAKTNAMLDTKYADIEERRKTEHGNSIMIDKKAGLGFEELDYQHGIINKTRQPILMPFYRYLSHSPVRSFKNNFKHAFQRLNRSWDDTATWSLDYHLTSTLGKQLKHLAETTHGWPQSDTYPEFEDWQKALHKHGDMLLTYANKDDIVFTEAGYDSKQEEQIIKNAQKSLRWVASNLPSLWD